MPVLNYTRRGKLTSGGELHSAFGLCQEANARIFKLLLKMYFLRVSLAVAAKFLKKSAVSLGTFY